MVQATKDGVHPCYHQLKARLLLDTDQDQVKRDFLREWTEAVNTHGGFGEWEWDVLTCPPKTDPSLELGLGRKGGRSLLDPRL